MDLMAEAQPAFCLGRQTANTQTHKNRGILSTRVSLKASSLIMTSNTERERGACEIRSCSIEDANSSDINDSK